MMQHLIDTLHSGQDSLVILHEGRQRSLADRVYANYTTSQYRNQNFCLEQNSPIRLWDEQQQG